jgi:hypothetical protein
MRFRPKIACQDPKPTKLPNPTAEGKQKERLTRQKYFHSMWHFSYAPFVKIEIDKKAGLA